MFRKSGFQHHSRSWLALGGALALVVVQAHAVLIPIVSDSFTGNNGDSLNGRLPDLVDAPGNAWFTQVGSIILNNQASEGNDGSTEISIASAGGYTKPMVFRISADLALNGIAPQANNPDGTAPRGITLGFFPDTSLSGRRIPFGIVYAPDGQLLVVTNNALNNVMASASGFSTTGLHNLAYQVDLANHTISDVTFDGAPVNLSWTNAFVSDANTMVAGFYGVGTTVAISTTVDNFLISELVPEPSVVVLLGLGGLTVWRAKRTRTARRSGGA